MATAINNKFRGQLVNGKDIETYMLAGKATVTFQSAKTGTRYTYKIRASKDGAVHFVSLLSGSDNTSDFRYIGFVRGGKFFHGGAKSSASKEAPSVVAFGWTWMHRDALNGKAEVWHEGRCGKCGRKLTVPESVARGLGPECSGEGYKGKGKSKIDRQEDSRESYKEALTASDPDEELIAGMTVYELRNVIKNRIEGKCPDGCCGGNGYTATQEEVEAELAQVRAKYAAK